jgi:CheY-like chemotaxis protein
MDGFEATSAIRAIEQAQGGHIPIVAMTAHAMKGDRERCLDGGMDAYVPKPLQINQLIEVIEELGRANGSEVAGGAAAPSRQNGDAPMEGFDLDVALAQVEGDRELLGEMIDIFFSDTPEMIAQIEKGLADGDPVVVQKGAHKIKGSVLSLGAAGAAEAALSLEMAGRKGEIAVAQAEFDHLKEVLEKLNATLASVKSTHLTA